VPRLGLEFMKSCNSPGFYCSNLCGRIEAMRSPSFVASNLRGPGSYSPRAEFVQRTSIMQYPLSVVFQEGGELNGKGAI